MVLCGLDGAILSINPIKYTNLYFPCVLIFSCIHTVIGQSWHWHKANIKFDNRMKGVHGTLSCLSSPPLHFFSSGDCKAGNRSDSQLRTSFLDRKMPTNLSFKSKTTRYFKQTNKPTDRQEVLVQCTVWSSEHGVLPPRQLMWGWCLLGLSTVGCSSPSHYNLYSSLLQHHHVEMMQRKNGLKIAAMFPGMYWLVVGKTTWGWRRGEVLGGLV